MEQPINLNPAGIKKWEKLNDYEKKNVELYLDQRDFWSYPDYNNFRNEVRLAPIKSRLLFNVSTPPDPQFIINLCEILWEMTGEIQQLDNTKQDISREY
jgi:hypothetical protein